MHTCNLLLCGQLACSGLACQSGPFLLASLISYKVRTFHCMSFKTKEPGTEPACLITSGMHRLRHCMHGTCLDMYACMLLLQQQDCTQALLYVCTHACLFSSNNVAPQSPPDGSLQPSPPGPCSSINSISSSSACAAWVRVCDAAPAAPCY